jgi:L-ascorbate metabolism protein UlaG (beta-lactamase superfamily)
MKTVVLLGVLFSSILSFGQEKPSQRKEATMNVDNIHWYGQSAFRIEDGQKQIYIDPWKLPASKLPKADIIFITHAHFDHFSQDDINQIKKEGTIIVAPKDVASGLEGNVKTIAPNQSLEVEGVKVSTIPAYNLKKNFHPKGNNWVGYILTLSSGETIYHAGDTDFIPEMKSLKVDVAMLPCGGTYTMNAKEAAEAANTFKPKIAIPMHFGDVVGGDGDAQTFKKEFHGETVIKKRER